MPKSRKPKTDETVQDSSFASEFEDIIASEKQVAQQSDLPPHVMVEARAGSGKTTTLVEGLKYMRGLPTKITPSEQQQAVWDQLLLSKSARSICFTAFNKSIADELKRRLPSGCDASTIHGIGFKAVRRAFQLGEPAVNGDRVRLIIEEITGENFFELQRKEPVAIQTSKRLIDLCRLNLVAPEEEMLMELADYYELECNQRDKARILDLTPRVLDRLKDVNKDGFIDFCDMIWLPIALDLPIWRNDLLLVDEFQDLNRCQQEIVQRAGERLICCGDPKQAIYGFAGADSESMSRMEDILKETPRGCEHLMLTVTRRCGKKIVTEAQRYVEDFTAHESNPDGEVHRMTLGDHVGPGDSNCYRERVRDGDMVICRMNSFLVSECLKFIREGRKATIRGRDEIGQGLINLLKKLMKKAGVASDDEAGDLVEPLEDWARSQRSKENAKKSPSESRLANIQDKLACLMAFIEDVDAAQDVITKIEAIFTDNDHVTGIKLSSIHKAKGLESERVFYIRVPQGKRKLQPWQAEQERNLSYVAITRAIAELIYVSVPTKFSKKEQDEE